MKEDATPPKDVQNFLERFSNESVKAYALSKLIGSENLEQDFLTILDEEYTKFSDQTAIEPYYEAIKNNIKQYTERLQTTLKDKITSITLEDIANKDSLLPKETSEISQIPIQLKEQEDKKQKTKTAYIANNLTTQLNSTQDINIGAWINKAVSNQLTDDELLQKYINPQADIYTNKSLTEKELIQKAAILKETSPSIIDQKKKDSVIAMHYDTCKDLRNHYAKQAKEAQNNTKKYFEAKIKETEMIYIIHKDQAFENLNSANIEWYNNNMLKAFNAETLHNKYRLDLHKLEGKKEKFVARQFSFEKDRIDHFFSQEERTAQDKLLQPKVPEPKVTMAQQIREALAAVAVSLKNYILPNSGHKTIPTHKRDNNTDKTR